MPKDWVISPHSRERDRLAGALRISPIVAQVLHNRGITDADSARQFLQPQMNAMHPPDAISDTTVAAKRIADAIDNGEKIVLFGDYDVDGITGVSILWHCLKIAGADVHFYIPHRLEEGYGVNIEALDALADDGAKLIITIDCGITAIEPALRAKVRGVDLIITDHHTPHTDDANRVRLPDATLVHPAVSDDAATPYPNPDLSGAGVALKLAWAVAQNISKAVKVRSEFREFLVDAMGLAALGIIADVVPLTGENRIIAYHGLRGLRESRLPGIQALIHAASLAGKKLEGEDIGFKIAPRLNAIGRMGHARLAVDMLTRADPDEAVRIAENLEQQNRARQSLQRKITNEALEMVVQQGQNADTVRGIVLASPDWHAGVIGIVASRVTEEFGRPTVMIAVENGFGQGSARSIRHFPLHEVLADCREHLLAYGGHAMAAGLRIDADKIDAFRDAFQARAGQMLTPSDLRPKLQIDDVVNLDDLSPQLVTDLGRLEPFGAGNPAPRLATEWLDVVGEPRTVGTNQNHLQVTLSDGRTRCKGIAFGMSKYQVPLMDHRRCRVAFRPILNEWQGRTNVEMQILDFRFPD
ncbi:MAG: single-stranded-DNA-specific exonuclease RecJ [Phycisphaerales bacterium]|nr:single-stranded-DNA-specific exonuclease RecJ [Phycisphaerales bacterium]